MIQITEETANILAVHTESGQMIGVIHTGKREKGMFTATAMKPFKMDGDDLQLLADKCKEVSGV